MEPSLTTPYGSLYRADCLEFLPSLQPASVDMVFADPPFNLGKDYRNRRSDSLGEREYLDWCRAWVAECARLLKPGGAMFVYQLPRWAFQLAVQLKAEGLGFRHWIALTMKSTFPRGRKLYPAHYALLYFTKGDPRVFHRLRLRERLCRHCGCRLQGGGLLSDFWPDTSPARHKKHKSRPGINELKPMIPERCILTATNLGDLVLDPFGGGGSNYIAAERNRRKWLGCEVGPVEPIIERFKQEFHQAPWQR